MSVKIGMHAKHTCIKVLSHGAIFLATYNAILLLVDVKLANTRFHHSLLIYSNISTFVTNLRSFTLISEWKKPIR